MTSAFGVLGPRATRELVSESTSGRRRLLLKTKEGGRADCEFAATGDLTPGAEAAETHPSSLLEASCLRWRCRQGWFPPGREGGSALGLSPCCWWFAGDPGAPGLVGASPHLCHHLPTAFFPRQCPLLIRTLVVQD